VIRRSILYFILFYDFMDPLLNHLLILLNMYMDTRLGYLVQLPTIDFAFYLTYVHNICPMHESWREREIRPLSIYGTVCLISTFWIRIRIKGSSPYHSSLFPSTYKANTLCIGRTQPGTDNGEGNGNGDQARTVSRVNKVLKLEIERAAKVKIHLCICLCICLCYGLFLFQTRHAAGLYVPNLFWSRDRSQIKTKCKMSMLFLLIDPNFLPFPMVHLVLG
jgi:hypothetical protein